MRDKQYAERNAIALDAQGGYYLRHILAMTREGLHEKSEIAKELAWRDAEIDRLEKALLQSAAVATPDQIAFLNSDRDGWIEAHAKIYRAYQDLRNAADDLLTCVMHDGVLVDPEHPKRIAVEAVKAALCTTTEHPATEGSLAGDRAEVHASTLQEIAIEELSQLGYTFKDGQMLPPDHVGELMAVVQSAACGCQYGTCETKANRACRMTAEIREQAQAEVQAEPVAWVHPDYFTAFSKQGFQIVAGKIAPELVPLYTAPQAQPTFQQRVQPWLMECFGEMIAGDREERNHRFLEEALELVQATGCTQSEAHQLVNYVFGRPVGEPAQEVGGVMVTLAALCLANHLDMHQAGESELARIWTKVEAIRAKQAAKPKHSPLPQAQPANADDPIDRVFAKLMALTPEQ
ncbi:hypothetical protein ACFIQG_20610, partial [Comamonas odontotermitis]